MGIDCESLHNHANNYHLREKYNINTQFVILFVGRLVEVKGCKYLIDSIKYIVPYFDDLLLIIVGSGPLENELKKQVYDNHLCQYVRFEGFIDHSNVYDYYALSDIVVVPSIVDSLGYEEGLPVTLLEGMGAKKPVIGTKTKGILEVIHDGQNGLLVDQKDPEQLAEKIIYLFNNNDIRTKLSKKALSSIKDYDWNSITEKYANIMYKLTSLKNDGELD